MQISKRQLRSIEYARAYRKTERGKLYRRMWNRLARGSKLPIQFPPYLIGPSSKPRGTRIGLNVQKTDVQFVKDRRKLRGRCNSCECKVPKGIKRCDFCIKRYGRV